jgi:molybdopterin-guanine dinucleotide biosynthesis protein A
MISKTDLTGIVLAGGKSRRLGMNKALLVLKGKKLIDYPLQLLEKCCSHVIISSNQPLPLTYPAFPDVIPENSPMSGIYSCLLQSKTPYNVILSCDMPFLNEDLIQYLTGRIERNKIIVPVHHNDLMEPLCAIYPTHSAKSLLDSIQKKQFTMHDYIHSQPHRLVVISDKMKFWSDNLFANINTPGDLEKFQRT